MVLGCRSYFDTRGEMNTRDRKLFSVHLPRKLIHIALILYRSYTTKCEKWSVINPNALDIEATKWLLLYAKVLAHVYLVVFFFYLQGHIFSLHTYLSLQAGQQAYLSLQKVAWMRWYISQKLYNGLCHRGVTSLILHFSRHWIQRGKV